MEKIKLLILDNDGVLTDGSISYDDNRVETKKFSAKDGLGLMMLKHTDIEVAVITGRRSNILMQRCKDLKINYLYQRVSNKLEVAENLIKELGIEWGNVAYLGDDWNDFPVLRKAGLSGCPNDVFPDFKEKIDYVCDHCGGKGAVREFIEYILKRENIFEDTLDKFICGLK